MALQHLRSSTADKRPTPGVMSDGQLAMNTNLVSPGLFLKDSNGDLVKVGPVHVGTTAPNATPGAGGQAGNSKGEQWLDTSSSRYVFKIWDGTAWRTEDGEFVNTSGDTMTGALVMDNQQQVRFRETTANGTNYIALQAPASVASDKTITLPDVTGTVVTTGDTGSVTSTMLLDGTILNADINASAAIAGTKVAPNFGSQNILTTGTATAASLSPTGSSVPSNGLYLPAANSVAISTNAVERVEFGTSEVVFNDGGENYDFRIEGDTNANLLFVDASTDRVGLGTSSPATQLHIEGNPANITLRDTDAASNGYFQIGARGGAGDLAILDVDPNNVIANSVFAINVDNTERLRITAAGSVGIGTTSPLGFLHIESPATTAGWQLRLDSVGLANESGFYRTAADNYEMVLRNGLGGLSYVTNTGGASTATLEFNVQGSERARIDSSGRLLVGTSTSIATTGGTAGLLQIHSATGTTQSISNWASSASDPARLVLAKSQGGSVGTRGIVNSAAHVGLIRFAGDDGTNFIDAATISAFVDGTPGTDDMPGRLVFSTTADGESSPTEAMRITNDRVIAYNQPTPTSKSAAATLTITELKTGIIQYTGAVATLTLPTGTLMEGGFSGIYTNMAFEWSVINTGTGICTIGAGTAHTIVGSATVAIGASARFVSRRTASNTFVSYCLS